MARTFYDVLGVDEDADRAEIRRTFRAKAKEHHPDVSDEPGAGERFKRINRAAEVLGDPVERKRYDRLGHETYVSTESGARDPTPESQADEAPGAESNGRGATTSERGTRESDPEDDGSPTGGSDTERSGNVGPSAEGATNGVTGDPEHGEQEAWTGFRDSEGSGVASSGGTIGGGRARRDRDAGPRWARSGAAERVDPASVRKAWRRSTRLPRRNPWLIALTTIGSGRLVDQWRAFRQGLLLVYLYPVLLALLLVDLSPPITTAVAAVTALVALYGSGIPNVGALVFGLLAGLVTVVLVQSPYPLSAPTTRVLLAACWLPLGHSVIVAWFLRRSER